MANYREIVTKAVISKGKKLFTNNYSVDVSNPSTVLGCWVINHNFSGSKVNNKIIINGSYDVNIWYSCDNDTKTDVIRETRKYTETINMREREETDKEEIIVRSLKQPNCVKIDIDQNKINYTIVGDVKVKVEVGEEDSWDEIVEDNLDEEIDKIKEDYIDENKTI